VSATAISVPSQAQTCSPNACDHDRARVGVGRVSARNSSSNGTAPSRSRSALNAVLEATRQPSSASRASIPAGSIARSTAGPDFVRSKHNPSTKYTPNRDGNPRNRCSPRSVIVSTSSTSAGGMTQVRIPNPIRDNTRPTGEDHPVDMAASADNEAPRWTDGLDNRLS
jgi:hypothetical protein